jgi:hypothetical protein
MSGRIKVHLHVERVTLHTKQTIDAGALDRAIERQLKGSAGRYLDGTRIPSGMLGKEVARALERRRQR